MVPTSLLRGNDADEDRPGCDPASKHVRIHSARSDRPAAPRSRTELLQVSGRVTDGSACSDRGRPRSRWPRAFPAHAAPLTARLFDSRCRREVKTISRGPAPMARATRSWASSRPARRAPAGAVRRRGVAVVLRQVRQHRLERFAPQRSRGGVVEVDRHRPDCTTGPRRGPHLANLAIWSRRARPLPGRIRGRRCDADRCCERTLLRKPGSTWASPRRALSPPN